MSYKHSIACIVYPIQG